MLWPSGVVAVVAGHEASRVFANAIVHPVEAVGHLQRMLLAMSLAAQIVTEWPEWTADQLALGHR